MWPFKKKKDKPQAGLYCPYCRSNRVLEITGDNETSLPHITVWRGIRCLSFECRSCARIFYTGESADVHSDMMSTNDVMIEDEEQLKIAENELKKQADIDGDHRFFI